MLRIRRKNIQRRNISKIQNPPKLVIVLTNKRHAIYKLNLVFFKHTFKNAINLMDFEKNQMNNVIKQKKKELKRRAKQ